MKIKLFSHCVDIGHGPAISFEQATLLETTGLLDVVDSAEFFIQYDEKNYDWLKWKWKDRNNINFHFYGEEYKEWYEATTENYLQEFCHTTDEEYYICHITHKGCSHPEGGHHNWRRYMQYWNIERWRDCVQKLDEGYETCGAAFLSEDQYPFYAGNFYWAKTSYLKRCKRLKTPAENNYQPQFPPQPHHRFDLECWHGSGNPKWYDMDPGERNRWYLWDK